MENPWGKPWKIYGFYGIGKFIGEKPWENPCFKNIWKIHGENPWENHGKSMGKIPWRISGTSLS
jgi:hypothetical protein